MRMTGQKPERTNRTRRLDLARVLVVQDELASRLTLQTILRAGGYAVDVAASTPEALAKLDEQEYELVLSDLELEAPESGRGVLRYARLKDYRPATAVVTTYHDHKQLRSQEKHQHQISVEAADLSNLLSMVADLIGARASRRAGRAVRQAFG